MRPEGKPFRWNTANPNLIKRLKPGETQKLPNHEVNVDRLIRCGASALRFGNYDFVFVGRSLEDVFDLLSGALARTTWYDRTQLVQMSVRGLNTVESLKRMIDERANRFKFIKVKRSDERLRIFASYLSFCRLMPAQILERDRPVALTDIVAHGTTFALLCDLLKYYSNETNVDWAAVKARLRWIAVIPFKEGIKGTPWQPSDSKWTSEFEKNQIETISLNTNLWFLMAEDQCKSTSSYAPTTWGEEFNNGPPPEDWPWHTYAARGSREMYRHGERSRIRLASLLGESPEPIDEIKSLVKELRREA